MLRTAQILGPGGPLPHPKNEVDRTTRSGDMAKPSADRLTRDRQTRLTANQPTSQPFCQYPAGYTVTEVHYNTVLEALSDIFM